MNSSLQSRPTRLLGMLFSGPLFLLVLGLLAYLNLKMSTSGITGWISTAFNLKPVQDFGRSFGLRMLLPLYFGAGVLAWLVSLVPAKLARPDLSRTWRGGEALGLGFSALLWEHLVLWWQVPTGLWMLPGLRHIPFIILFPLLAALSVAYPCLWLMRAETATTARRLAVLASWLLLWSGLALAPQWVPWHGPAARGGSQPCRMLMVGVDGLRSDTFLASPAAAAFEGLRYENAYTAVPATRLLWHSLWGGDLMTYTIGNIAPSKEEFEQPHELLLLRKATAKGWRPRFYIDDGGTVGTVGRIMDLDDLLMPAAGWENFVNSNLAVSFPIYAKWENVLKPFPTTNPWSSLDAGLKESLRLGRGSGWVMFHTCLAHQPIFLDREELGRTGRWWTLSPDAYRPRATIGEVTAADVQRADPRTNPFRGYQIRMESILRAWQPIWNGLSQDPQYQGAARFLFSDHGERFHNVANGYQLQGVHGYNLDPWECRVAMLAAGPGFADTVTPAPRENTVGLLGLRDGIRHLLDGRHFDASDFETSTPRVPFRFHTLTTDAFGPSSVLYRSTPVKDLALNVYVAAGGIWYAVYTKSAQERAMDASVGFAEGPVTTFIKPIVGGGAMETVCRKYELVSERRVSEEDFRKVKSEVEKILIADDAATVASADKP